MRLPVAEITFRTKAAESIIREASRRFPEMFIGAGTILNTADLHRAFDAGAKFAVAPGFNPTVVGEAMKNGYAFAPGICTPSEIEQAYELGCRFFKFFPAEAAGRRQDAQIHCRALQTPRNQIHAYRRRHDRQCGGLACSSRSFRRGWHMAEQGGRRRHQKSRGSCKVPLMN